MGKLRVVEAEVDPEGHHGATRNNVVARSPRESNLSKTIKQQFA